VRGRWGGEWAKSKAAAILAVVRDSDDLIPGTTVMVEALWARVLRQGTRGLGMPTSARYVVTTVNAFGALLGGSGPGDVGGSDVIVVLVLVGRFSNDGHSRPRVSPVEPVERTVMHMEIDAATGQTRGWGLGMVIDLSALGQVTTLA